MPVAANAGGDIETVDLTSQDNAVRMDDSISRNRDTDTGQQNERVIRANELDEEDNVVRVLDEEEVKSLKEKLARRGALPDGHKYVHSATSQYGLVVKGGSTIQRTDDKFFLVKHVVRESTGAIYLLGMLLMRNGNLRRAYSEKFGVYLHSFLPLKLNDLCMVLKTNRKDLKLGYEALEKMSLDDVVCERQIVFTNLEATQPYYSELGFSVKSQGEDHILEHAPLVCRWKYVESIDIAAKKARIFWLTSLEEHECDKGRWKAPHLQRRGYGKCHTGSHQYSFADVCAGGGGASRGAQMAKLKLMWALDHWDVAVETLRANGMHRRVLLRTIQDFVSITIEYDNQYRVDVIHISFPCPGHSHLNRGQNPERDMINNEVMTVLGPILDKLRPRIVTMEQTNGILTKNDGFWLRKTIQEFSAHRYSTTWKVCKVVEHGVACLRQRLIVMAAW